MSKIVIWTVTPGLTERGNSYIIKSPRSREVSGVLYLQSALAGVISTFGYLLARQPFISGVEALVLRNGNFRTVSGQEWSSTKRDLPCAVRLLGLS